MSLICVQTGHRSSNVSPVWPDNLKITFTVTKQVILRRSLHDNFVQFKISWLIVVIDLVILSIPVVGKFGI